MLDTLVSRADLELPDGNLYGCPQTLFKFHPDFDDIILNILDRDPNGVLVLIGAGPKNWKDIFIARLRSKMADIDKRIHWTGKLPRKKFLELLSCFDVMLDPFPFGGGNTTLEAFAMGTPVVTMPTEFARCRLASVFYKQMCYEELVAADPEHYIELALEVVRDPQKRAYAKRRIEESRDILYLNAEAVGQFEASLLKAYEYGLRKQNT